MKKLIIFSSLLLFLASGSNPDKKVAREKPTDLEQLLECVDKSSLKSGILYDKAMPFANLSEFNSMENISELSHFEQALNELYIASDYKKFISNEVFRKKLVFQKVNASVPLGIINSSFQTLNYNPDCPEEGGFLFKEGKFEQTPGKPSFISKNALVIAPLKDYVIGIKLIIIWIISFLFFQQNVR
jgi:hypothetical protein